MPTHLDTGKTGELLGLQYLLEQGFVVMEKNWRFSRWEVDVIAERDKVLHFIEIKTRRSKKFGWPEDKVGKKKIQFLINAAEAYLYQFPQWQRIQFNILSISILPGQPVAYFLIEDVFL